MPRNENTKMDEKIRFASVLIDETVSRLCKEFGIYRVTRHNITNLYDKSGLEALRNL